MKKARKSRKTRASNGSHDATDRRPPGSPRRHRPENPELQRHRSNSVRSPGSHRSQLVDLVVEDRKAEDDERIHVQRAFGSVAAEPEHKHFRYVAHSIRKPCAIITEFPYRRPSGDPVDEPPAATDNAEDIAETSNEQDRLLDPDTEELSPKTPAWNYGDLEDDNVWSR